MKLQSVIMAVALAAGAAGTLQALDIDMETVSGRVIDKDKKPIEGVTILIESTGTDKRIKPWTGTTEKKGIFINDRVIPGPYKITFSKEGYKTSMGSITVLENKAYPMGDITLLPPPPDPREVFKKVDELVSSGKYDEAEVMYKDIIEKATAAKVPAKDLAMLEFDLGLVYEKKQDWPNAETQYKKAIEIDPTLGMAYGGLGNVYQAQNRPDDAIKVFQDAAKNQPTNGQLAYDLGLFMWSKGQNEEAYQWLQKAQALMPENPEVLYHLGVTAVGLNKGEDAIKYLEKYVSMNPTNKENLESAKVLIPAIKQTAAATSGNTKTK
jgi:Flp pilus assembly protein TadD